jgi:hypothetical protein
LRFPVPGIRGRGTSGTPGSRSPEHCAPAAPIPQPGAANLTPPRGTVALPSLSLPASLHTVLPVTAVHTHSPARWSCLFSGDPFPQEAVTRMVGRKPCLLFGAVCSACAAYVMCTASLMPPCMCSLFDRTLATLLMRPPLFQCPTLPCAVWETRYQEFSA